MNPLANVFQNNNGNLSGILSVLKNGGNPDALARTLYQSNPQFKAFYENNRGKSIEQICRENNIDMNTVRQFMK